MEQRKVICDSCGRDLTECKELQSYSLRLINRMIPMTSSICITVETYPILEENLDFCGLVCLKKWLIRDES